jgi:glycosyltransferase involved in cell wall biosynthesis
MSDQASPDTPGNVDPTRPAVLILNWRDTAHPEGGGSEVYVEQVASGLVQRGVKVTLFCARPPGALSTELRDGFSIVRRGGRFTVYVWAALYVVFRRLGRFDRVLEVQNGMPFLATLYTRRPVTILVHHVHREQWSVVLPRRQAQVGWWLESRVAPRVNRHNNYITVSRSTAAELVELGIKPASIRVVHNGYSAAPERAPFVDWSSSPSVVVLGRLVPHKRVEIAMDAVAELLPFVPGLTLHVVGQGWWERRLREHAERLELGGAVTFHGYVDEWTKHRLLAQAWVLAMPSLKEGWGLVVIEAAQHSTPAVAFDGAGGLSESIEDGRTGLLASSPEAFTQAIGDIIKCPARRDELGARAAAASHRYTWTATVDGVAEVLGIRPVGEEQDSSAAQRLP